MVFEILILFLGFLGKKLNNKLINNVNHCCLCEKIVGIVILVYTVFAADCFVDFYLTWECSIQIWHYFIFITLRF